MKTTELGTTGKEIFHNFARKCAEHWPYVYTSATFEDGWRWWEVQAFADPLTKRIDLRHIVWLGTIPTSDVVSDRVADSFHFSLSEGRVEIAVRPKPGYEAGAERTGMVRILLERNGEKIEG